MVTRASATTSRRTTAPPAEAFAVGTPLTPVGYYPKSGPLPAVVEVENQTGPWDARGQTRKLHLSDGGSVIEHLVVVEPPHTFVYELSDFQKLFGWLVSGARADWRYVAEGSGTRITWTYTFFARPRRGLVLRGIVHFLWAPYMKKVLPGIVAEIDRRAFADLTD